jgi:deoxyribose-phosphate aldolase
MAASSDLLRDRDVDPGDRDDAPVQTAPESTGFDERAYEHIDLAPMIEHALLHPAAGPAQVAQWCAEADRYRFATVCVTPALVPQAVELLHGKEGPAVCAVVGYPLGASLADSKTHEAMRCLEAGARELDVMLNLGWLKTGEGDRIHRELAEICEMADGEGVKAILEMGMLTPAELELAVEVSLDAGVQFFKTHTGWNGGVTVEQVQLLGDLVGHRAGIKAAGGIQSLEAALMLAAAGATRLGTSRGVAFLQQRGQGRMP